MHISFAVFYQICLLVLRLRYIINISNSRKESDIMNAKIEKIKSAALEDTKVVSVSYESGTLETENGVFENLPQFYRVVLHSSPEENSFIRSELWLPDNWNGIFIGLGNGGMAGGISHAQLAWRVSNGYAAANTDMGTSRGTESGINNPAVWKDFGWRATHIMTVISKAVINLHYGKDADYSYFVGGSTGGEQALSLAQRFPADYDGIIAGVPANNRIFLHTYFLWNHNHLRTKDGKVMFDAEQVKEITLCGAKYFQTKNDGEKGDNFVSFPQADDNTIDEFVAFLKSEHPEFCQNQLDALKKVYKGPINPRTGERIYNGMPIGSEMYGCGIIDCQAEESPHYYPFIWSLGENCNPYDFDFDKDLELVSDALSADMNANNPDLSEFNNLGGKLIMYSGSADPCVPFPDAMRYYERVCDTMGGYERVSQFAKYFLMPGKDHGGGGLGTNALRTCDKGGDELDALRMWREKGISPNTLTAVKLDWENDCKVIFEREIESYNPEKASDKKCPPTCSEEYLKR